MAALDLCHYQCAKAGFSMFTKGAAYELAPKNIRVNTIAPGLTATNINKDQWQENKEMWESRAASIPMGRPGIPEDHVSAAIFLASDEADWVTGAEITVDGGKSLG